VSQATGPGVSAAGGSRIRVALAVMGLLSVIAPHAAQAYITPLVQAVVDSPETAPVRTTPLPVAAAIMCG